MRLINADDLKKTLRDWIRDHWLDVFAGGWCGSDFADMIDDEDTVDAVPVTHAHWIFNNEDASEDGSDYWADWAEAKCSNCGYRYITVSKAYMYYPNCGAAMQREPNS